MFEFLRRSVSLPVRAKSKPDSSSDYNSELVKRYKHKKTEEIFQEQFNEWIESGEETASIELDRIDHTNQRAYFHFQGLEGQFFIIYDKKFPLLSENPLKIGTNSESLYAWASLVNSRITSHASLQRSSSLRTSLKDSASSSISQNTNIRKSLPLDLNQLSLSSKLPKTKTKNSNGYLSLADVLSICAHHYLDLFMETKDFVDEEEDILSSDKIVLKSIAEGETDDLDLGSEEFKHSLELLSMKKQWLKKEQEIRENTKKEDEEKKKKKSYTDPLQSSTSKGAQKKKTEQIFTSVGASGVLINDLLLIMENRKSLHFDAKPIENNIYHWRVRMFDFDIESSLGKQLREIKRKFNYNYIELEVKFMMDLYPFYPPLVKLVRPRFQGFMMGRVTTMDILKVSFWDPVKDMRYILSEIRNMIKENGILDVENLANEVLTHPEGAYSELEYLLLRLELLSETESRVSIKYRDIKAKELEEKEAIVNKKAKESKSEPKDINYVAQSPSTFWAKGTGYGHSGLQKTNWDVQAYLAAQREKNSQLEEVLNGIAKFLNRPTLPNGQAEILQESCLVPVLESYLRNDSLLDMGRQSSLYLVILNVVKRICHHPSLIFLLDKLEFQTHSIFVLLKNLSKQAKIFVQRVNLSEASDAMEVELAREILLVNELVEVGIKNLRSEVKKQPESKSNQSLVVVEVPINEIPPSVTPIKEKEEKTQMETEDKHEEPIPSTVTVSKSSKEEEKEGILSDDQLMQEYEKYLRGLQFDTASIIGLRGVFAHHYLTHESDGMISREKILRLAQEQGSLVNSLPLNLSSSVFVRVDEERVDMMQALITGPSDTPYDGGCFQFDIYFPSSYPHGPPLVNLQTTGGGTIRFNPNLYNCGKVCLSLLGTWSGADGETWNKDTSTLLQVLVSIQSLILVPFPYFNEPGYERQIGSRTGEDASRQYNEVIRVGTVELAMLGQLRNPPPAFAEVIRTHFYIKQHRILKTLQKWLEEAKNSKSHFHHQRLSSAVNDLKSEFAKLKPPILPM